MSKIFSQILQFTDLNSVYNLHMDGNFVILIINSYIPNCLATTSWDGFQHFDDKIYFYNPIGEIKKHIERYTPGYTDSKCLYRPSFVENSLI